MPPEGAHFIERDRIEVRVAFSGHAQCDDDDQCRREKQQQDRDGAADGDRRYHTFTNFRKSTLRISPMDMKNIMVADPPYETKGSGMPVTATSPICIPTLMMMWKMKKQMRESTRNVPPRSRDCFATESDSMIRKR